ncbi:MAG: IclR family transcriptional regulator [Candidatus Limnocylindrales bacterium]
MSIGRSPGADLSGRRDGRVQAIERAFAVLSAMAEGPLGVTEIAQQVELPKSTVARLLASLQREGAAEQEPGGTRYRLGSRIVLLAATVLPARAMVVLARPELEALSEAIGEAAGLSVPEGFQVHYVDQVDTPNPVSVRDWTGTRVPMHAVPSGLVILANLAPASLDRFLARPMEAFTETTVTDPSILRRRLRRVQHDGFAWVFGEFSVGINSVAAGVANADGEVVAAVHLHGPSYRFPGPETGDGIGTADRIGADVVACAARISARIRSGPTRPGSASTTRRNAPAATRPAGL